MQMKLHLPLDERKRLKRMKKDADRAGRIILSIAEKMARKGEKVDREKIIE